MGNSESSKASMPAGVTVSWYSPGDAAEWDAFVSDSPVGNFLHTRTFLGYHGTRYEDRSLVYRDSKGAICGLMPAALHPADPNAIVSHPGATYGGLLLAARNHGVDALAMLQSTCVFLSGTGLKRLVYK